MILQKDDSTKQIAENKLVFLRDSILDKVELRKVKVTHKKRLQNAGAFILQVVH